MLLCIQSLHHHHKGQDRPNQVRDLEIWQEVIYSPWLCVSLVQVNHDTLTVEVVKETAAALGNSQ